MKKCAKGVFKLTVSVFIQRKENFKILTLSETIQDLLPQEVQSSYTISTITKSASNYL
jgi:hypothetical protein